MKKKREEIIMLNGTYCAGCGEVILKGKLGMLVNYVAHKCEGRKDKPDAP